MNERIKELMLEAGYAAPELAGRANKLAELIVRECAVYVKNSNCFTYASQADLCSERMKEHFGVEE
jgi:hypothetical protein